MDYKVKYNNLVTAIRQLQEANPSDEVIQNWVKDNVTELCESEGERIRKMLIDQMERWHQAALENNVVQDIKDSADAITWLEKQQATISNKDIEKVRNAAIYACQYMVDNFENSTKQYEDALAWLENQDNEIIDSHQNSDIPNGGIVFEDFNSGEGFYKLHLDYLNKAQIREIEALVRIWNGDKQQES